MNQLQTIVNGQVATMSSLEISELTGKRHDHVIRDIRAMLDALKDAPDLGHVREDKDTRGYTAMFHLDRELTDTLLTGYSVPMRRKVVARWHELEAKTATAFEIPQTYAQALMLAAQQAEKIDQQKAQLQLAAPKVAFVERYVEATGLKGFREVCKLLKANENRFREFLLEEKVMYRLGGTLTAYQNHIDAGRFEVRTGVADANEHAYTTTKFTPKGIDWIAGEWAKHQLRQEVAA